MMRHSTTHTGAASPPTLTARTPSRARRGRLGVAAVLALGALASGGLAAAEDAPPLGTPDAAAEPTAASTTAATDPFVCRTYTHRAVGRVSDPALQEISGMARGRRDRSVMWVHEDSGAKADVHALSLTGQKRQTFRLTGVTALDWEDMDVGPGPQAGVNYLYLGDIGGKTRSTVTINRVPEPAVTGGTAITSLAGTQQIVARYPDGPRNAESMAVGTDGTIYVFSKEPSTHVYMIKYPQTTSSVTTMTRIDAGVLGTKVDVSGADIRPDGRALIVRGYKNAWQWPIIPGESMATTLKRTPCTTNTYRDEAMGEAIAFLDNDGSYTSTGEAVNAIVRQYTL